MSGITYDTGALLAAEDADRRMWALHRRALERGESPMVPAGVLGQAWRGGPQVLLARLLAGCQLEALSEEIARSAGTLLGKANAADVIDASLVIGALARRDAIVTSDRSDVEALLDARRRRLQIIDV